MEINVEVIDYNDSKQAGDLVFLLDLYSKDPMGSKKPLDEFVKENLALKLAELPFAFSLIIYVDNNPAGLANCFDSFSTFKCKPIVNIHDLTIHPDYRGKGLSLLLLKKIEELAVEKGCCKLTLEVLEGNRVAQNAYEKFGFSSYELDPETGRAMFWEKKL